MTTFHFMRHGSADYDLAERRRLIGGCRDWVPLTPLGIHEVEQSARKLARQPLDLIVSSPMTRAMHTSAILTRHLSVPLVVEFDLHEWIPDTTFQYNSWDQIQANIEQMKSAGDWPPGATCTWEPLSTLRQRALAALHRYAKFANILIVCHSTLVQALTGHELAPAAFLRCKARDLFQRHGLTPSQPTA